MRRILCSLILAGLAGSVVAAEPLTRDRVERFVGALEQLVAESERYESLSREQRRQLAAGVPEEMRGVIESHGFTPQSWSRTAPRVFRAVAALEMDSRDVREKMAQARERIRNNPDLSAARKKQMLQMLEQQQQAFGPQQVSSADKAAVKPYRDRLMALTEAQ